MLAAIIWYCLQHPGELSAFFICLGALHLVVGTLETLIPARPDWRPDGGVRLQQLLLVVLLVFAAGVVAEFYGAILSGPLQQLRNSIGLNIWPHHWPALVQIFMVFFASELIWYWVHRAEHRFTLVWRLSGHGAHHSFKCLSALNFGLNHPLELFLIALPAALIELTFGVGSPALAAAILGSAQASMAHSNLDLNSRVIGWLFTTNRYHIHHHSMVLPESNTNFGCAAIFWDRLFGTFADAPTREAGTGASEPTLLQKLLMPLSEPVDTAVAPR
ncbi:MAG: sterol desaturase family protein [Pseudomonadales bacterium]